MCNIKRFGMDAEFSIGKHGRDDANIFFDEMDADKSGEDDAGCETWEHRTNPSDTAHGQIKEMRLLQKHLASFTKRVGEPLCRSTFPCGTHIHLHCHIDRKVNRVRVKANLISCLALLALIWNTRRGNIIATAMRLHNDYGYLKDVRSTCWGTDTDTCDSCSGNNCDDCDQNEDKSCDMRNISFEYRGFTSPNFSLKSHVRKFGAVLRCIEWLLDNVTRLPRVRINDNRCDKHTISDTVDNWGDSFLGLTEVWMYRLTEQDRKKALSVFKTPAIKQLLK